MKKRIGIYGLALLIGLVGYGLGQRKGNEAVGALSDIVLCRNYSTRTALPISPVQYSVLKDIHKPCPEVGEITFLNGSTPQSIVDFVNLTAKNEFASGTDSGGLAGYMAGNTQGQIQGQMLAHP
jgi:hypothetical protein